MFRSTFLTGLMVASAIGCNRPTDSLPSEDPPKVAYVTNCVASFWVIAQAGVEAGGQEFDAQTETVMPTGGGTDQQRIMEDLVSRGFDGIAVSPIDPENQTGLIDDLSSYTNMITHDSDAPNSKRLCYIGVDNYIAGRMCGELLREALPGGGKFAIFVGRMEQDNAKRRRQGIIDGLLNRPSNPDDVYPVNEEIIEQGYHLIGTYTDQTDRPRAKSNAEDVLSRHPDVAAMVGLFAYNPPMILEALRQAGKTGDVKVIGFDEADETLRGIREGEVYGTVVQNPYEYGRQSVRVLAGLSRGQTLQELGIDSSGILHIPPRQIRRDNVDAFWKKLRANMGETS